MREKVLSLAKGNFIYETPELVLSVDRLEFQVTAGTHHAESFVLRNARGTKIKGFGSVEDVYVDFLPFFEGETNELTVEVNARELVPGEHLRGELVLVTDCGEERLPYDIEITIPSLADEKGPVRDYYTLQERIKEDPERGADLFFAPEFADAFLFRDESGKILYDTLIRKNTKLQSMEEFLVTMKKKEAVRFEVEHSGGNELMYELDGTDIQDTLLLRVNTWGHTGIHVTTAADFIELQTHVLWTDEFERGQDILEFTILADKVPVGCRTGEIVLQSHYETKTIPVRAHNRHGEQGRKIQRAKRKAIAMMIRMFLAYQEKRITRRVFQEFLKKNREILEKISGIYTKAVHGYIVVMLQEEEAILEFFQETEAIQLPPLGVSIEEVESYIMIEYIKALYTGRPEDKQSLTKLIATYEENGYQSCTLTYIRAQIDERYRSLRLLEQDVRAQIGSGSNSPLMYSILMLAYREDTTLIASLDEVTVNAVNYGLKRDLITKEISLAVSFLGERLSRFNAKVFAILQKLYDFFVMTDTLRGICGMLIRSEIRNPKHFPWFAKGVSRHLRLTDLFEYYMYTLDTERVEKLPDAVLSYFQFENHLNDRCKAFLFAYILNHREEQPDVFETYTEQIQAFTLRQLTHHRISPDLAVLYEGLLGEEQITGEVAEALPYVLFTYDLHCPNEEMDGVVVVHREMEKEEYYPLENGWAQIQIYTPNVQIFFLDERRRYYAGTVDYEITRLLRMDEYAPLCFEQGARMPQLLVHLAYRAERAARLEAAQAQVIYETIHLDVLRLHMKEKLLLCLYDYYKDQGSTTHLLEVLDEINPTVIKRERISEVAADCIYRGMYEKAQTMLLRYGVADCELRALSMLVSQLAHENEHEWEPLLVKWALLLFRQGCYDKGAMEYLRRYYVGDLQTLTSLYRKCMELPEVGVDEDFSERLLAQVVFTGADQTGYEDIYLKYFEEGKNRMLVKAFLAQLAYDYVVERVELSEALFVKIEKEAMYEKDTVMLLATLRHYRGETSFAGKQKEFVELNLEKYASEGVILAFMKDYIGKVMVPYEIENTVLIQYYSGTDKGVFLCEEREPGEYEPIPMRQVFPGVYIYEMLLFEGEERKCYIYEEELDEKTDIMSVTRPDSAGGTPGFFRMVNQMITAKNTGDQRRYEELRRRYESDRYAADQLFTIH